MVKEDKPVLYLNLEVIDGSNALKEKVKQRVEKSPLPTPWKGSLANRAARVAAIRARPARIAQKMGTKLCESVPQKMAEMGLIVEMEQVFLEGPFVVLQLQVQYVDARAVERWQREEHADIPRRDADATNEATVASTLLEWCLRLMGSDNQKRLEHEYLPEQVQHKLETRILDVMAEKFERKGLVTDIQIIREERQARYFFHKLKRIRGTATEEVDVQDELVSPPTYSAV